MNQITDATVRHDQRRAASVGRDHAHESAHLHVAGSATYIDDLPELAGTLHAALGLSPLAHGRLKGIDLDALRALPGVVDVLSRPSTSPARTSAARSCTTTRSWPRATVQYLGQPVFAVIADTRDAARRAAARAKEFLDIEPLPAVLTVREAHAAQSYVVPPMHLTRDGDGARSARSPARRTGCRAASCVGGQEQFYLEGQISYAVPLEDGGMRVHCSTQHPSEMQHVVAHALRLRGAPGAGGMPAHGRRLRRQGIAVGAVRLRRRGGGAAARAARSSCASTATTTS